MITPKSTPSTTTVRPVWNSTACSIMPMPMAAIIVRGRLSIRPMTAAASARSIRLGPSTWPICTPWMGRRSSTPMPDMPAAMTHTSVLIRLTGTPRSEARSDDSAEARIAMPRRERRKNSPRPSARSGTTTMISRCPPLNTTGNQCHWKSNGTGGCGAWSKSNSFGSPSSTNERIWAMPMVATVRTRRGAVAKRRMMPTSTT